MNKHINAVTIISSLIFLVMIPIAIINETTGWIPDLIIFIALTLFYRATYDTFRMNSAIFTMLILGHILHACGIFGWYNTSPIGIQWDHITHYFGAFAFSLLFFNFISQWFDNKTFTRKNMLLTLTIFLAATGVGAIVELSEFLGYLTLGFGDGALMFGPGDGITGLTGTDLIDAIGGGWINEGWDFVYNTLGIITGMIIMSLIKLFRKTPEKAYYYETIENYSKKI